MHSHRLQHDQWGPGIVFLTWWIAVCSILPANGDERIGPPFKASREISREILTKREWNEIETAIDKGLEFLISQCRADGSFQAVGKYDPGISALCVLAFLSRGHLPGQGPYGDKLRKTVDFIIDRQQADGLLSGQPKGLTDNTTGAWTEAQAESVAAAYNHGIAALVLAELFGSNPTADDERLRKAIERAIEFTSHRFPQPKLHAEDEGAWRYLNRFEQTDSDLSITSWNLMFLRSAKNSGFDVNVKIIDEALAYIKRNYDPTWKTFRYEIHNINVQRSNNHPRGMAGAGILALALAGEHDSEQAINAAKFILNNPFHTGQNDIYPCYGAFYCSNAMFQLGGESWNQFYPQFAKHALNAQRSDRSWLPGRGYEEQFGTAYGTALTILALTPPYQLLPILQR